MSGAVMKKKHFENPYPDYAGIDSARDVLVGDEIRGDCKIRNVLQEKWHNVSEKIEKYYRRGDCSVYTGSAGIAMLYLKKDDVSVDNLKKVEEFLYTSGIKSKRRITFLCGDGGPLAIGAVVAHKMGDQSKMKTLVKTLVSLKADAVAYKSDLPNEYLYGRAGYLFALLYVNKHISPPPVEDAVIKQVIEAIIKSGVKFSKEIKSSSPLMFQWHDSLYLGAAHGLTGIIYLLLQAKEYLTESELNDIIKPSIDFLAAQQFPSGNYPSSLVSQSGDKYVQWCHGAPGFLYMFSIAYKVFKEKRYLDLALSAGDVIWKRGLVRKGYSICHGVSGNAYCFLELYQTTNDVKHLYRAIRFADWCIDYNRQHEECNPDRPLSLYEGIAGPMYLLLDIQDPMNAKFPGFTL